MNMISENDRIMAFAAGFVVSADTDQPGLWVWTLTDEKGQTIEGCDASFASEDDAWSDVVSQVIENTMGAGDISDEQWDALSPPRKLVLVKEAYERA